MQAALLSLVAVGSRARSCSPRVLHYRGAFNNVAMYAPLTAPLFAVVACLWAAFAPGALALASVVILLWLTFLVGFVGLGMHLRGFGRQMGGLYVALFNWLEGPPAFAPALFVCLAANGLAAVYLSVMMAMKNSEFRTKYPGYNVLDKWSSPDWDEQTRAACAVVSKKSPPVRFFNDEEARTLSAIVERIIPQPDRDDAEKISIVPWIDEKLYEDKRDGYRYEALPPQREAWRLGLKGIDEAARALFDGKSFAELDPLSQDVVLTHIARGDAPGAAWERMPAAQFFKNVL